MGQSGVKKNALGISGNSANQAATAYNTANPIYTQEATSPTGYTPQQRADMLTASNQSLGGGVASAVGQGALTAARTGNSGGSAMALDDAARSANAQASSNALDVSNQNAQLMERQKQEGLAGLNGIYNTGTGSSISALNTANNVQPGFLKQFLLQGEKSAGDVAAAYMGRQ